MSGYFKAFYGLVRTKLVNGIPRGGNRAVVVYRSMLRQITREYSGLPDCRTLKASEIRFFYEGLRPELERYLNNGK